MGQPEKVPTNPAGTPEIDTKGPSAADRLRGKATDLRGPRGKYRCRKCRELPCICPDPKSSTPAAMPAVPGQPPPADQKPLFTEARTKRILDALFGVPTLFTNCKIWALTADEAEELGKPAADVLNEFVTVDPKWATVAVLAVSGLSIVSRKAVLYNGWKRAMMIQKLREHQERTPEKDPPTQEQPSNQDDNGKPGPGPSASIDLLQ